MKMQLSIRIEKRVEDLCAELAEQWGRVEYFKEVENDMYEQFGWFDQLTAQARREVRRQEDILAEMDRVLQNYPKDLVEKHTI